MTVGEPRFVTPAEACGLLESLFPVTERTLGDWRRRHALPSLVRQPLGPGCGRGAVYGWTDPEILVQVATLKSAQDTHCRLQWMKLAAWFAGFDYPTDEMRRAWSWWCRRGGVDALGQHLGWPPIGGADLPDAIQAAYDLLPPRRKTPGTLAFLRAELDPAFTGPSSAALDDVRRQWRDQSNGDVPEVLVRGVFDLQWALGSASVEAALADVTADQFARAHRDARVLLTPVRVVATRMLDSREEASSMLVSLLPRLGHQLHKADLILRHNGHGERIDRTIDHLQALGATPVVQAAFWEAMSELRVRWATDKGAPGTTSRPSPETHARFAEYWDDADLRAAFNTTWRGVRDAWADFVGPLVADFLAAFDTDLAPGGRSPL